MSKAGVMTPFAGRKGESWQGGFRGSGRGRANEAAEARERERGAHQPRPCALGEVTEKVQPFILHGRTSLEPYPMTKM